MHVYQASILLVLLSASAMTWSAEAEILTREHWGARPAIASRKPPIEIISVGEKRVRAENIMPRRSAAAYLTIHHTALPVESTPVEAKLQQVQKLMQNGYVIDYPEYSATIFLGDIPYHYFIKDTGEIAEGRKLRFAAYSNTTYLTPISRHITVVLEGDFQNTEPTTKQIGSLIDLLERLAKRFKIKLENITHHKAVTAPGATTCPGVNLINQIPAIKEVLAARGIK